MDNSLEHIAFILDGNRRWAKAHGMPALSGHKKGYEAVRKITEVLPKYGIKYVTYYAFSTENWNRSKEEVKGLFGLFREVFDAGEYFARNNFRFVTIGDVTKFPKDIFEKIKYLEDTTANNTALTIIAAINYGGRDEIIRAMKKIARDISDEKCSINDITEERFASYLDTKKLPYPDAVVRTSEQRISNFLIWQLAYSEIFFLDKLWPDFNEDDLKAIVDEFSQRKRRYGK